MAALGVIAEANIGSNEITKSIASIEDHPLLYNLYYGVKTVLGTDAPGVMNTSKMKEYGKAKKLIAGFCSGDKYLEIDTKASAILHRCNREIGRHLS